LVRYACRYWQPLANGHRTRKADNYKAVMKIVTWFDVLFIDHPASRKVAIAIHRFRLRYADHDIPIDLSLTCICSTESQMKCRSINEPGPSRDFEIELIYYRDWKFPRTCRLE
jgi:hypothetical protein